MSTGGRRSLYPAAVAFIAFLGAPAELRAHQIQQVGTAETYYTVSGMVIDRDGNPISDANVDLVAGDSALRTARSDAKGRFRLEQIARTPVNLRVRRIGFQSKEVAVAGFSADHSATVEIRLDAEAAKMDPVTVSADSTTAELDPRLAEFRERRQKASFAHFIDAAMIAASHSSYLSDVLRKVPGVVVRPGVRIGNAVRMRNCSSGPSSGDRGAPLLWIDGVRVPSAEVDEAVRVADVAGVEVYSSLAGVPTPYQDRSATCGTILVWTKSGR